MGDVRLGGLIARLVATLGRHGEGDGELLDLFVARRDEAAFEALVRRHGPVVLGICRGVLGQEQDAEDAFQATFLALARKAASVRPPGQVGNWLRGAAYRAARHAKRTAARRRAREALAPPREPEVGEDLAGLREALDEGLAGLPVAYREVIVLCDLEGKGRKEVAGLLGCPEGTVASRLARAREALAKRLERHGLAVPGPLAASTAKGAVAFAAGQDVAGAVPARVVVLAAEVLGIMASTKLTRAALLLLVALLAAGVGVLSAGNASRQEETATKKQAKAAPPGPAGGKAKADEELKKLQGTWVLQPGPAWEIWGIAGEKLTRHGSEFEMELVTGKIQIDPAKRPKTIDISFPDTGAVPLHGIYEMAGDTLKVCLNATDRPRPTTFEGAARAQFNLMMRRDFGRGKFGRGGRGGQSDPAVLWVFKRHALASIISYDMVDVYYKNAARADEKFIDQRVTVTGRIERVTGGGGGGRGYALLIYGTRTDLPLSFGFSETARKQLSKLEPGQVVTVQGNCRGRGRLEGVQEVILFDNAKIVTLPD